MSDRQRWDLSDRPRGWNRRPGDAPVVGWLALAPKPKVVLPQSWPIRWVWDLAAVDDVDESIDVIVADPRGAHPAAFQQRLRRAHGAQEEGGPPELLLMPTPASDAWAGKYGARLLPQDGRSLPRRIHEEAREPVLRWVAEQLLAVDDDSTVLRQFVQYGLLQRIPSEADAVETLSSGGAPYVRTVPQMLDRLGCGRSWLYAHLPFPPGKALSAFMFLHGLIIYCRVPSRRAGHRWVTPWSSVASRLGFRDPTGWTHFCNDIAGVEPRRLRERTLGEWIETALRTVLPRSGADRAAERGRGGEIPTADEATSCTKLQGVGSRYRARLKPNGQERRVL